MSLMGIDVGTTGCKAAVYSLEGTCLGRAYREYPTLRPRHGWAELDSQAVWNKVREVIAHAAHAARTDPVSALAVSSMGEAVTPVTLDREILGNAILTTDERGAQYVEALLDEMPEAHVYGINPNIPGPNYSFAKLAWVREHEPELWERADLFLPWSDLVTFMLGCPPGASFSLANRTMLFDFRREDWSERLLKAGGIPREKLPPVRREGQVIGRVGDAMAEGLGLPRGVEVVMGAHDQCCNALGAGVIAAGEAVCGIGTFECIAPAFRQVPPLQDMLAAGLSVEHHPLPGLYVSFLYNLSGSLVRWFRDTFAATQDGKPVPYEQLSAEMPPEPTGLIVLPYFEMSGAPDFVGDASGVVAGLRLSTTRGDILKAIMEGATYFFAHHMQTLASLDIEPAELTATGGGARSDAWLQIKADILNIPLTRPAITECTALGAAMLAGIGTGVFTSPAEAKRLYVRADRTFRPDRDRHRRYAGLLERYSELLPLLRDYLATLSHAGEQG